MKSIYRLKKNYQYNYVYKHAQSVADKNFVLLYCKSNNKQSRVGFSISKKYGHAVERNRLRRQLKAVLSDFMPKIIDFCNIIVVPRKSEAYLHDNIVESVELLLNKAGLIK